VSDLSQLEVIATELIRIFEIHAPPVPIEIILQRPKANMWKEVDITELSISFVKGGGHFSPRMSLARLLARHVVHSDWGGEHGLETIIEEAGGEDALRAFARMLIMPHEMVKALAPSALTPITMSMHFEVPEEDASLRLGDLAGQI
jgi:hypothetical protein